MEEVVKSKWLSKTFWMGLVTAAFGLVTFLFPSLNPELSGQVVSAIAAGWGVLAVVLRFVTKDKIVLWE